MTASDWRGKSILVVGIGRSGYDAARVLHSLGAEVVACDAGTPALAAELERLGVQVLTKWRGGLPNYRFDLVVTSPGVPAESPVLREAVKQGISVWSEVELAYRLCRSPIVAVTGTNGKSTTAALVAHILSTAGYPAVLCGNIAAEGMERTLTAAVSTARPQDILVAEVSSFQLEWVHELRPYVGIWTTLSVDHLNRHHSFEEYGRTKARLLRRQTEREYAVLPCDDEVILSLAHTRAQCLYFSHKNIDTIYMPCIYCDADGVYLKRVGEVRFLASAARFGLPGEHNRRNLAAAIAACSVWELTREQVEEAIATFRPLPHRMEWVAEVAGVHYVNNSMCTNLQSLQASVRSAPAPVVLIMGGVDKSDSAFEQLVPLLKEKARCVVLIGADAVRIEQRLQSAGWEQIVHADSLEEAVSHARARAQSGDWVMLAPGCASFDMFTDFQERGTMFREIVHRLEGRDE